MYQNNFGQFLSCQNKQKYVLIPLFCLFIIIIIIIIIIIVIIIIVIHYVQRRYFLLLSECFLQNDWSTNYIECFNTRLYAGSGE